MARRAVSIIIKALNEERHVARAIESALAALAATPDGGEVILADGGSRDRTVAIAARTAARVVQLARARDRGCGAGPQLGYQYARHPFICLIDGDMALDPAFLAAALAFLEGEPRAAGVGGRVAERNLESIEFRRRARRDDPSLRPGAVDRLNGGGLYRREAIEGVGYLSDRNLHGYEEIDLALRLRGRGFTLHRLDRPFVDHYGHTAGGYALLLRRFRSGYIFGIGEVLRGALGRPHLRQLLRDLPEARLWLGLWAAWAAVAALAASIPSPAARWTLPLLALLGLGAALVARSRSVPLGLFALASWHANALGLAIGLLRPRVPATRWLDSREIAPPPAAAPPGAGSPAAAPAGVAREAAAGGALALLAALALAAPDQARAGWAAIREPSLAIRPGSPLDLSPLFPTREAGAEGRVVARPDGHLGFALRPEAPVRFLCASLSWSPASGGFPDHAGADLYAAQLRRHGYNAARFHFVDNNLMSGRHADFDYDPVVLDRVRYLMAALKREGLYWVVDAVTSTNGGYADAGPDRWTDQHDLKLDVHLSDAARAHWLRLVRDLYATPNPYTGRTPLEDPALALVVLDNENGIAFDSILHENRTGEPFSAALKPAFARWLKRKYGSDDALAAAWPDLRAGETLAGAGVSLPARRDATGPRMRDAQLFFAATEAETAAWMTGQIRALGYPGLVSDYNNGASMAASLGRAGLPAVTANTYHDEVDTLATPLTTTQRSSLDGAARYLRDAMGTRWLGRPFLLTEYDHSFWNPYRHEAGAVAPAYAALQGWDLICRHAFGPIDLSYDAPWPHKRAILPYDLGLDPVGRASETLAALLFRRGDVSEARGTVAIPFGTPAELPGDGRAALPDAATELGLVSRLGLAAVADPHPPGAVTLPAGAATPAAAAAALDRLRQGGAVAPGNRTDPARGIFESDTGQIELSARTRAVTVVTPRTEAASFAALREPLRLGRLTVEAASGPALVAVSALDGAPLPASRRLLVIYATDAANTGMVFADAERRTVLDFGRRPALIERGTLRLALDLDGDAAWRLSPLGLDGARGPSIALRSRDRVLRAALDNAAPGRGPTTFFLLERVP